MTYRQNAAIAISQELHAPDIEFHMAQKEFGLNPYEVLSDFQVDIENVIAEGDLVAARFTIKGTHSSDELGIPSSGKRVSYPVQIIYRFQDGKVKEAWTDWDSLYELMRQLGMELTQKEGKR